MRRRNTGAAQSYVVDDLGDTPAPTVVAGSADRGQVTELTFLADPYEAAQEAAGLIAEGEFGYFDIGTDTYVFANIGAEADQANSDDFMVELNGVTPTLTVDDFLLA